MQTYDLVMLAVLAFATIFGFWKGLAWQVASLASLVVSYFAALKFADKLAPMVSEHAPFNKFAAMLIIYAGTSLAIWMAFRVVAGAIDGIKLKEFDRQMGALVGFAKGVLICIAITFFALSLLSQVQREKIIASRSGHYIVQVLDKAEAVAPPEIKGVITPYIERINQQFDPNYQPNPQQELQDLKKWWGEQAGGAEGAGGWPAAAGNIAWPGASNNAPPATAPSTPAWPISTGGERQY